MKAVCKRGAIVLNLMWLMLAWPAWAQLQVGDNTSLNLNGNISVGYTADFSNQGPSDHTMNPSGNADLTGFFYNPGFLSFDVQPFFDQSRVNSTNQSVFQSSGVSASASIFSGSHFPGTINYSKGYNNSGGYVVPGVGNLTTYGNDSNFALGWGITFPQYPKVSFQFTDGNSNNTLFGTNSESTFHQRMFGVTASEMLHGFSLAGGVHHYTTNAMTPEILAGLPAVSIDSSSNSYDFNVGHKLPLRGAFSAQVGRSDVKSVDSDANFNGTIDIAGAGADFQPITNLTVGTTVQYTNNLEGQIYQSAIISGVVLPALNYSTTSLDVNNHASYVLPKQHLTFSFIADHRDQTMLGTSLTANTYEEMATYGNDFLGGFLSATGGLTQTTLNTNYGSSTQGQFENVSYQRSVGGWTLTGSGNYTRNTQTVLIGYTSTGYGFSAGIGRKLSASSYWSVNAVDTKTTFNNVPNSGTSAQSYATAFSLKRISLSGSYGKSDGTSILTPTGLVPVTNPTPIITPLQTIMFAGHSYSLGAGTQPIRGLVLGASYSDARSNTAGTLAGSENTTRLLNGMLQYKVRQLWIVGGYLKLQQGFSITGQPPLSDTSYYMGITRWFKFF
jgi:hypothetical protein